MIYTDLIVKALNLSYQVHKNRIDKDGIPHIFHLYHLAEQMNNDEELICVSLLHDVLEYGDLSIRELINNGFSSATIVAISLLNPSCEDFYSHYLDKIKDNALALTVKIADIEHNIEVRKSEEADNKEPSLLCLKYHQDLQYLLKKE